MAGTSEDRRRTSLVVALMVAATLLIEPARGISQPAEDVANPQDRSGQTARTAGNVPSGEVEVRTCPMHPNVRWPKQGKCPICGTELTPVRSEDPSGGSEKRAVTEPTLSTLQEMLSVALTNNPDVRAAEAQVRSAEAELDRTRLGVVQKIIAFRERWQKQRGAVHQAEMELRNAERLSEQDGPGEHLAQVVDAAKAKLAVERARRAEIEAELPFLLGTRPGGRAGRVDTESRRLIEDELLPKARQMLQVRLREYRVGKADLVEVIEAHRQLMDLEIRVAKTRSEKIAIVEAQRALLNDHLNVTEARYRAGQAPQSDVLSISLEISKTDLRLLDLKGE